MTRRGVLAAAAGLCAAALGCDSRPKTAVVRGRVTFREQPLASGTVTFIPANAGPPATGDIQPDGQFTLTTFRPGDGAVPGRYDVMVIAVAPTAGLLPEDPPPPDLLLLPRKYASHRTSGLVKEVSEGDNIINIRLD